MSYNSEPHVNTVLADILRRKNPTWRHEDVLVAEQHGLFSEGGRPDILLNGESPIVIETEFAPARTVMHDARRWLGKSPRQGRGPIEHAVSLRLPASLRTTPQDRLSAQVASAQFDSRLLSVVGMGQDELWPSQDWYQGDIDDLAGLLETAAVSERRIAANLAILQQGIDQATAIFAFETQDFPDTRKAIARLLNQHEGEQTFRMAMAIVANALTFQSLIAGVHSIRHFDNLKTVGGRISKRHILAEWTRILTEINYWPIFSIAREIVRPLRESLAAKLLTCLSAMAADLAADGVTQSHDLYGRLFQRLIADRKYLATFYTLPSSALLLAETAVAMLDHVDWQDPASIRSLRIADFACGTGTLIAAACSAVYARHRRHGGDDAALHAAMMEKSLIACDIMPAATHLAAAMLSSLHPTITFGATQIHTLPYGERPDGAGTTIGALDLIDSQSGVDLFGDNLGRQMHGQKSGDWVGAEAVFEEGFALHHESVDLVIMNPPFTRPTNHEGSHSHIPVPSFAGFSTGAREQRAMAERLRVLRRGLGRVAGHGNAGLASHFIDLAHVKLKPGGVMAMVVPLSFAQGDSWRPARELIARHYSDIKVLSIAQAGTHARSFSSDTGMGEALVIARKKDIDKGGAIYTLDIPAPATGIEHHGPCVGAADRDGRRLAGLRRADPHRQ